MLTAAQQLIVKTHIESDQVLNAFPHSADGAYEIAAAFSVIVSPDWIVWRSSVSQDEIMQNGFDWTRVDNLSVGKARIWQWMFDNEQHLCNPSKINVRAGIDAAWVGTAADLAVRAAVYSHCKRSANRIEKLLSTGTGTTESPATMGYEGSVSYNDIQSLMGW